MLLAYYWNAAERRDYVSRLVAAFAKEIRAKRMALKPLVSFRDEMRDLRRLLRTEPNAWLRLDQRTGKRNVLMVRSPGATHTYWSRYQMWEMATKYGNLRADILKHDPRLLARLVILLDVADPSKATFRVGKTHLVPTVLSYLQQQYNTGSAFPPFHARFFADRYLPHGVDSIVVDPCAGWGGRLLGTLCVSRESHVRYVGVDPNRSNQSAYAGLMRRIQIWLKREMHGERSARVFSQPFENWITSASARRLYAKADLVITSPPYFAAEVYKPEDGSQSANRYREYKQWHDQFFRPLVRGAYQLLKPGGMFVLNIADVTGASLERDARKLALEQGFVSHEFFKLAMSRSVGTRGARQRPRHAVQVDGVIWKHEPIFCFKKPSTKPNHAHPGTVLR